MDIVSVQKALQANECDLKNVSRMNLDHVTCDMVHEWASSLPEANHAITKVEWFERDSSIIELRIHEGLRKVKIWTLRFSAITRKIFQVSLTRMINISGRPYPLENTIMVGNVSHNTKKYGEYYPHGSTKNLVPGNISHAEFLARGGVDIHQWVDSIARYCATYDECIALLMRDDNVNSGVILTCMAEEGTLVVCVSDSEEHQIIRFIFDGTTRALTRIAAYAIMWDSVSERYTQAEHIVTFEDKYEDSDNDYDEEME